jgi:hypothetical protein
VERETGIEPATNGLGSRDSTTELLPLSDEPSVTLGNSCRNFWGTAGFSFRLRQIPRFAILLRPSTPLQR